MKYVKICTEYSTAKDINICNKLLEELKTELCKFHDYTIALSYEESEKEFKNDISQTTEDFIEIIKKKISGELDESTQPENDLLKEFDAMRKLSNLSIRMKKSQNN